MTSVRLNPTPVPFADRLLEFPIVLEVVPPHRRASDRAVGHLLHRLEEAMRGNPTIDAVNIPEVLDENHEGDPFYRNLDPRAFAMRLLDLVRVETIVNKVVVHFPSGARFESWARESLDDFRLRNVVLVGGTRHEVEYPGPDIVRANEILGALSGSRRDVTIGNIAIPERRGEVDRLVRKTRAGCRFFTTQVLFEPDPVSSVLREYGEACTAERLRPATVLLSFAPVSDYHDVEFLVWLGASIAPATEEALLAHRGRAPGAASLDVARSIWTHIRDDVAGSQPHVPLGVNIEEISAHNFDLAVEMARAFPSWNRSTST